jgi:hypothetical protein
MLIRQVKGKEKDTVEKYLSDFSLKAIANL